MRVLNEQQVAGESISGTVLKFSGRQLTLALAGEIAPGTPVRIDVNGGLILGEVLGGTESAQHTPALSVAVDQVIPSLSDLARLVQSVCGGRAAREPHSQTQPQSTTSGEAVPSR